MCMYALFVVHATFLDLIFRSYFGIKIHNV
jgi:hypothetical protein